jgi:lysophospholipase L1-like esterase
MKRILCYGDSNTWGTAPMKSIDDVRRWGPNERWPCVMANALGSDWTLIEEGLPGRTTVHDDPIDGIHMNGKTYLQPCLDSHWPLDVIAVMLGTNDLKHKFSLNPIDIAFGVGTLLFAMSRLVPPWTYAPKILLICPAPAVEAGWLAPLFQDAESKAVQLASLYKWQADRHGAAFFDAGTVAKVSPVDGVHFDADQHRALGLAIAGEVKRLGA